MEWIARAWRSHRLHGRLPSQCSLEDDGRQDRPQRGHRPGTDHSYGLVPVRQTAGGFAKCAEEIIDGELHASPTIVEALVRASANILEKIRAPMRRFAR